MFRVVPDRPVWERSSVHRAAHMEDNRLNNSRSPLITVTVRVKKNSKERRRKKFIKFIIQIKAHFGEDFIFYLKLFLLERSSTLLQCSKSFVHLSLTIKNSPSKAQLSVLSLSWLFSVLQMVLGYHKITFLLQFESLTGNLRRK